MIWDAENMKNIPKPSILTLDPNDENIILGIPDDIDPTKQIAGEYLIKYYLGQRWSWILIVLNVGGSIIVFSLKTLPTSTSSMNR